jgi:hypothetical protein
MGSLNEIKKTAPKGSVKALKEELDDLKPWIKWIAKTTPEGEKLAGKFLPIEGRLIRVEKVTKSYGKTGSAEPKEVFVFYLEIDGRERQLDGSRALYMAAANADVDDGDMIRLTKSGEMKDTRYVVEKI